jgi:hypothetical protein
MWEPRWKRCAAFANRVGLIHNPQTVAVQSARCFDMDASQVHTAARQLFESTGSKAIAIAARKANDLDRSGDAEQARHWRRIEAALVLMTGPCAS